MHEMDTNFWFRYVSHSNLILQIIVITGRPCHSNSVATCSCNTFHHICTDRQGACQPFPFPLWCNVPDLRIAGISGRTTDNNSFTQHQIVRQLQKNDKFSISSFRRCRVDWCFDDRAFLLGAFLVAVCLFFAGHGAGGADRCFAKVGHIVVWWITDPVQELSAAKLQE